MKRILFITPYIPQDTNAGAAYTKQLLEELAKTCLIDVFYFRRNINSEYLPKNQNINIISAYLVNRWSVIGGLLCLPWLFPIFSCRFSPFILSKLKKRVEDIRYDFLYFDFSQLFVYAYKIDHPRKILMAHDVIAQKYGRKSKYLLPWVKFCEKRLLKKNKVIFTFSPKDTNLIKELYNIESIPTTFFLKNDVINAIPNRVSNYYVMFGSWGRHENYTTISWVHENVTSCLTEETVIKVIGGGRIPTKIKKIIESDPRMEYIGFVENPYPIIANSIAEIVPLKYGAGVKVKCVEALACGVPIIGTSVAFEGIPIYPECKHFMIEANSADSFVTEINTLNFSVDERLRVKKAFCLAYNDKRIINYIKNEC